MSVEYYRKRWEAEPQANLLEAQQAINEVVAKSMGVSTLPKPLKPLTEHIEGYLKGLGDGSRKLEGLSTGCAEIDELIGGLNRFVIMAARAGTGKSTLAVQLGLGVLQTEHIPVIYYSFEMSRANVMTMMMQNLRRGEDYRLGRNEIVLDGRAPRSTTSKAAIAGATKALIEVASMWYTVDTADGAPTLENLEQQILGVKTAHNASNVLVIIDSIQDLVKPDGNGATQAEAATMQRIVEIQQVTNATFLAISQKAKGGNVDDPYAGVLGSVALMHKPTTVVELRGVHDLIRQVKDSYALGVYRKLADLSDVPRPVVMSVLKGRNNGYGNVCLQHYGKYSLFETGKVKDYDIAENSLYGLNSL